MIKFFKKYKYPIILILLFNLLVFISAITYSNAVFSDISDSVFRLHVIANSDTQEDQDLKLKVRDSILEYINNTTTNINSKEEFINYAQSHIEELKNVAETRIKQEGYSYKVNVEIGNFPFPTKTYGNITFPSGNYDGLKIKIGKAEGQNWWCVMFPPLCFIDISSGIVPEESKQYLKNNMNEEEYALVSNKDNLGVKFKFKLLELFADNKLLSAKK